KYEGLGNDFIVLDAGVSNRLQLSAEQVRTICDRHLGIGGDGVLLVEVLADGPYMRVRNADGSLPEMCGNGLRCVALHLHRTGRMSKDAFVVRTDAGPHRCHVHTRSSDRGQRPLALDLHRADVEVEMSPPSFSPESIPMVSSVSLIDTALEFGEDS